MKISQNQVEKLKYNGNVCIAGLTASGKTTHSHLLSGEFGLTYVSGSQIQLNFLGLSPIQTRDFWISEKAQSLWNHEQFRKIDFELLRLEQVSQGYVFDGSTMPWRHKKDALCIWLESDLNSRVVKSIISHHGRSNVLPSQYEQLIREKDKATVELCKDLYGIRIGEDLECFDIIIDISSIIKKPNIFSALNSIKIAHRIIRPAVGWYLTKEDIFLRQFRRASLKYKALIKKNSIS